MNSPQFSQTIFIESYETGDDHAKYKIFLKDEHVNSCRYSEFEALGKSLSACGLTVDWQRFPTKLTLFVKKDAAFYEDRRLKLQNFVRNLIREVIKKDSLEGQNLLKTFLQLDAGVDLPKLLLKTTLLKKQSILNTSQKPAPSNEQSPLNNPQKPALSKEQSPPTQEKINEELASNQKKHVVKKKKLSRQQIEYLKKNPIREENAAQVYYDLMLNKMREEHTIENEKRK